MDGGPEPVLGLDPWGRHDGISGPVVHCFGGLALDLPAGTYGGSSAVAERDPATAPEFGRAGANLDISVFGCVAGSSPAVPPMATTDFDLGTPHPVSGMSPSAHRRSAKRGPRKAHLIRDTPNRKAASSESGRIVYSRAESTNGAERRHDSRPGWRRYCFAGRAGRVEPSRGGGAVIAQLTGRVDALGDGTCVLDVNGVGYLVHASSRTLAALPQPPASAKVLVETHVREDAILLYGFADSAERDWFRLLTTVQGVGGRVALSVLSALSPRDLIGAIAAGDKASLTRAPGVGARLAVRLLTELRDKAGAMPSSPGIAMPASRTMGPADDAISALVNLGYRRTEVQPVVTKVAERLGDGANLDTLIRESLRDLAKRTLG